MICLALDGPCLGPTGQACGNCTAWAAAAADGHTFGGALMGADHTPYAERMALWYVTAAASAATMDVLVLTDNEAVARRFDSLLRYGRKGGDASEFWHQLLARWRPASRLAWIPLHGKRPGWTPPAGYPSPDLCRAMNAAADSAAKQLAHDHGAGCNTVAQERRDAVLWASTVTTKHGDTLLVGPLLASFRLSG
jgi:hypothetical protein